jgi:hypothetical protein
MNNEPVAWAMKDKDGNFYDCISPEEHGRHEGSYTIPLYTHPVKELTDDPLANFKPVWQEVPAIKELTDDEIQEVAHGFGAIGWMGDTTYEFARAILRKALEK